MPSFTSTYLNIYSMIISELELKQMNYGQYHCIRILCYFHSKVKTKTCNGWLNGVIRRLQQYFSHITATVSSIHVSPGSQ